MKKVYLCEIVERYCEFETTKRFLIESDPGKTDEALQSISDTWRDGDYDDAYDAYWFDGFLHTKAEIIREIPADEVEVVKKYFSLLS